MGLRGTFDWNATTLVVAHVRAGNQAGLGYTYGDACIAPLVRRLAAELAAGRSAFDICGVRLSLARAVRNSGRPGVAACAISAIDAALWDLKAKLLGVALATLLGRCRESAAIYGSGGFTTYSDDRLRTQLSDWAMRDKCRSVKMKIGRDHERDPKRAMVAKSAIGDCELFVDANGAFSAKQALRFIDASRDADIRWFEEPVTSDNLPGLRLVRERPPMAWISQPANTSTISMTPGACSRQAPWTCCKPTSPAAAASPAFSRSARSARPTTRIIFRGTVRPRCIGTWPARFRGFATSNGFMTTCGSSKCFSTARPMRSLELFVRILHGLATASNFKAEDAEEFRVGDDG